MPSARAALETHHEANVPMIEDGILSGAQAGVALHWEGLTGHTAHTEIIPQPSAMLRQQTVTLCSWLLTASQQEAACD